MLTCVRGMHSNPLASFLHCRHHFGKHSGAKSTVAVPGERTAHACQSGPRPAHPENYQLQVNLVTGANRWVHRKAPDFIPESRPYNWAEELRQPKWVASKVVSSLRSAPFPLSPASPSPPSPNGVCV